MNFASIFNINYLWANLIVEELIRNGVDTFCISSGSRSAPLTLAVAQNPKAHSLIHFDERASAFRALGIAAATQSPCAIITTSGTAAANLFPAIVEASKKKLPLIVLTADRPPELRATGAHQTIDQVKMYGDYVRMHVDMPCPTTDIKPEFILTTVDQAVFHAQGNPAGPVHINCMVREPLAPVKTQSKWGAYLKSIRTWQRNDCVYTQYARPHLNAQSSDIDYVAKDIKGIKSGIIIVGKLSGEKEQKAVLKLAEELNWPVFPDISSGLRLGASHQHLIPYFDQILLSPKFTNQYQPDGVLHFGGRMTSKRWYEYIEEAKPKHYIMILNHPLRNDPLHIVTARVQCRIDSFCDALQKHVAKRGNSRILMPFKEANQQVQHTVKACFDKDDDLNEPHIARLITQEIPKNNALFISSSMPIRDVDMYGTPSKNPVVIGANRGASGIDGTIASAVGFSTGLKKKTTLLIGDLAFLYDLNALAMLRDLSQPMLIIVLNNNGGGIFSFLPVEQHCEEFEKFFGTPHHLTFNAAAELFDLNYAKPETAREFLQTYRIALKSRTSTIIEIQTDRAYNLKIHQTLQNTIKNVLSNAIANPERLLRSKNGSRNNTYHVIARSAAYKESKHKKAILKDPRAMTLKESTYG